MGDGGLLAEPGFSLVADAGGWSAHPVDPDLRLHKPCFAGNAPAAPWTFSHSRRDATAAGDRGADALSAREQSTLLSDPIALCDAHYRVWAAPDVHSSWGHLLRATRPPLAQGF